MNVVLPERIEARLSAQDARLDLTVGMYSGRKARGQRAHNLNLIEARLREMLLKEERRAREASEKTRVEIEVKNTQLEEAKRVADQANQAKSQFLASVGHELRTPLNAIIGYSEMMEEEASRPPPSTNSDSSMTSSIFRRSKPAR